MSNFEHIFINSELERDRLAEQLAVTLGLAQTRVDDKLFLARPAHTAPDAQTGGELAINGFGAFADDAGDESVIDGYRYVWSIAYTGSDEIAQVAEARQLFVELAEAACWPILLALGLDVLLAAWNPTDGLTWFSPDTSVDAADRDRWRRYALPRLS
ncbi:hypothetical protein GCM10023322_33280 [Rugosimonospora acidiphila]|uniref:Uncharacterized protein n=1 Tax=Rugosimonospora acidiphila TaxID=556531 RepID=A0ABP9RTT1_9ACTN